ncbi:MAG: D-glycero-beta-D-manno-heptose-7-phosphate kinase [Fibrobacterota bacterium]
MNIPRSRFQSIARKLKGKKIIILGDVILDKYIWGNVDRISPEAPVPVVSVSRETLRPGGGANVANNLKAVGAVPLCISVVGEDGYGDTFRQFLKQLGISSAGLVTDPERPTTIKTRVIAGHQQVVRFDLESTADLTLKMQERLLAQYKKTLATADAVIISDYAKGVITRHVIESAIQMARMKGLFVAVDPKDKHITCYRHASLITPNQKEAEMAVGFKIRDEDTLHKAGWTLKNELDLNACLITRGENGMALFEDHKVFTAIPTMARDVFDVTGAGDTVISVLTAAVAGGAAIREAAIMANHAAGIVIREVGTATASLAQIEAEMFR